MMGLSFSFSYALHLYSSVSLSLFSLICLRHLRGNKVASAHIPFFLSSPKERKGRLVMLRSGALTDVPPCNFGSARISSDVLSTQTVDRCFNSKII